MPFVSELTLHGDKLMNPTWEQVAQTLEGILSARRGFLQLLGEHGMMTICPSEDFGVYVSAYGVNELAERLLIDTDLGMSAVKTVLGGASDTFPRCVFVDNAHVRQAVAEFFRSGCRLSALSWADPFTLYAEDGIA